MTRRHPVAALVLAVAVVLAGLGWAWSTRPVDKPSPDTRSNGLVVVGLGGVSWNDVTAASAPTLWGLLRDGAAGAVTVKTRGTATCPTDGWATLGAGEGTGLDTLSPDAAHCPSLPTVTSAGAGSADVGPASIEGFGELAARAAAASTPARLGQLGTALTSAGRCAQAIGPGAALALAGPDGTVERYSAYGTDQLVERLAGCTVSLIDIGTVHDPHDEASTVTHSAPTTADLTLAQLDDRVRTVLRAAPAQADVIVVGVDTATPDASRQTLQVLAATGPNFPPGTLRSASTRITGVVQLSDLTATITALASAPALSGIGGRPVVNLTASDNSEAAAGAKRARLDDIDTLTSAMTHVVPPFLTVFLGLLLVGLLVSSVVWHRAPPWRESQTRPRVLRWARRSAMIVASMPAATFLANLVPWWRLSTGTVGRTAALLVVVAVIAVAIAAVCIKGPWRTSALGPLAACAAITVLVIGADLVTGSRLQTASVFGLQPLVGGRFYGMGNVAFALYGSATLLLAGAVGSALARRSGRVAATVAVVAISAIALAIDVAPMWGADFGGPMSLVPAVGYLAIRAWGARVRLASVLVTGVVAGGLVALVAWLDWRGPAEDRTHLGRFVQTLLDGDALPIVQRKITQNIDTALSAPWLLVVGLVLMTPMVIAVLRPGTFGTGPWKALVDEEPLVRHSVVAVLVMCLIGLLTNDTGTAIPPTAAILVFPLLVGAVMHHQRIALTRRPVRRRSDRIRL